MEHREFDYQGSYERQLTQDVVAHHAQIDELIAWDQRWDGRTVHDGRSGHTIGADIGGVLSEYQDHLARLPGAVEQRLAYAQQYFAGRFTESPLDEQRWRSIRYYLAQRPLTAEIPMHIAMIDSLASRQAMRVALDLDVWHQLQLTMAAGDIRSYYAREVLAMASTPNTAFLMARAVDQSRQQHAIDEITRFGIGQFIAGELFTSRTPNTQAAASFVVRLYSAYQRGKLPK